MVIGAAIGGTFIVFTNHGDGVGVSCACIQRQAASDVEGEGRPGLNDDAVTAIVRLRFTQQVAELVVTQRGDGNRVSDSTGVGNCESISCNASTFIHGRRTILDDVDRRCHIGAGNGVWIGSSRRRAFIVTTNYGNRVGVRGLIGSRRTACRIQGQ